MNGRLIAAIVAMMLALTFYTVSVWTEHQKKRLERRQVILFWLGLVFDTTGTTIMGKIANGFELNLHGITGLTALILMAIHVILATVVYLRGSEHARTTFYRYSIWIWAIWMIPFVTGIVLNMGA